MNLQYKHLLPADFHPGSKVWIYQANRMLSLSECLAIEPLIEQFVSNWKSHGSHVKAYGNLFFGQFLVLMADETASTTVGGCSTDSSVRFVKQLEQQLQVSFFDRTTLAFVKNEKIQTIPLSQVGYALANQLLQPTDLYFNNLADSKIALENNWMVPIKDSWLAGKFADLLKTSI